MKDIVIDNEFAALMPPQTDEEIDILTKSCVANGIQQPLILWSLGGILLDGHTRYRIAQEHNLSYTTEEVELADRDAAYDWIMENQMGRRNLSSNALSYLRGKEYLRNRKQGVKTSGNSYQKTRADVLAEKYGTSEKTIRNDADFSEAADYLDSECILSLSQVLGKGGKFRKADLLELERIATISKPKAIKLVQFMLDNAISLHNAEKMLVLEYKVIIDEEFSKILPPLSDSELQMLTQSCIKNGILCPLKVWKGHNILLDGHQRYNIAIDYGLDFEICEIDLQSRYNAYNWIIENQLSRKNLTDCEISLLRGYRYKSELRKEEYEKKLASIAETGLVRIDDILIGDRARSFLGDIRELADSISKIGLLQPIVLTDNLVLIDGLRRIEAFKLLGRTEIPVNPISKVNEELPIDLYMSKAQLAANTWVEYNVADLIKISDAVFDEESRREHELPDCKCNGCKD